MILSIVQALIKQLYRIKLFYINLYVNGVKEIFIEQEIITLLHAYHCN